MIPFFQDFGTAIDGYFLDGYEINEDDIDDSYGDSRIYTHTVFLEVFNSTVFRFFDFNYTFPCSYEITPSSPLFLNITTIKGVVFSYVFDSSNTSRANEIAEKHLGDFVQYSLRMFYLINPGTNLSHQLYDVGVISNFDHFMGTGIILWNNYHERTMRTTDSTIDQVTGHLSNSISLLIIFLCIVASILEIVSMAKLGKYSIHKAKSERTKPYLVFFSKLDYWEIITLIINLVTATILMFYIKNGAHIAEKNPWPHFLLAIASFIHCFILFRYLELVPSTLLVVRMITGASLTLAQFIVGCIPFFCGYVVVGVGFFGWYCPLFTSIRQALKILIASSYGDYLLDGYDDLAKGSDKPHIIPSLYLTSWIMQSLGIWFYVVLSILHEALIKQVHKARDEEIENGEDDQANTVLPWLVFDFE